MKREPGADPKTGIAAKEREESKKDPEWRRYNPNRRWTPIYADRTATEDHKAHEGFLAFEGRFCAIM